MRLVVTLLLLAAALPALADSPAPSRQPSFAALLRDGSLKTFESLAGEKRLSGLEVSRALAEHVRFTGRRTAVEIRVDDPSGPIHLRAVQTGVRGGRPVGYLLSTSTSNLTGERVSLLQGTEVSWVRRSLGHDQVALVVQQRNRRDASGRIVVPAGTVTTTTREHLGRAIRKTTVQETLTGFSRLATTTYHADGRSERYELYRDSSGRASESRVRWSTKGIWKQVERSYDENGLRETLRDARGEKTTVHSEEAVRRLFGRLTRRLDDPRQTLSERRDRSWSWRQASASRGAIGTIAARGRGGSLSELVSGFVSPLGTRYGEVRQSFEKRPATKAPARPGRSTVARVREYHMYQKPPPVPEEPTPDPSKVSVSDRLRLAKARSLYHTVGGNGRGELQIVIDPGAGDLNAFADPSDRRNEARIGPGFAKLGLAAQLGLLAHEGNHERHAGLFRHPKWLGPAFRSTTFAEAGQLLEAETARLLDANLRRRSERTADGAAGKALAKVRKLTGDPTLTPKPLLDALRQSSKGQPHTWTPTSGYDRHRDRSRALWRAYGRELKR